MNLFSFSIARGPVLSFGTSRGFLLSRMSSVQQIQTCIAPGPPPGARLDYWQRAILISVGGLILGILISCIRSFADKLIRQYGYDYEWMRKKKEYRRRVINTFQHGVNKLIHMVRSDVVDIGVIIASGKDLSIIDINNSMRAMLKWPDEFGTDKVLVSIEIVILILFSKICSTSRCQNPCTISCQMVSKMKPSPCYPAPADACESQLCRRSTPRSCVRP